MSDYLDRVEAQLTELTEKGTHRRFGARRGALGRAGALGSAGAGDPRPPRRRNEVLAFLAAAAIAAVVVAIILLNVGTSPRHTNASSPAHSSTTATTPPTTTTTHTITQPTSPTVTNSVPLPSHFSAQSFTAISELTWWVLGSAPCSLAGQQPPCGAILLTTDGGRTFTALQTPRASLAGRLSTTGYSQIRFADLKDGFAYGPDLYVTHDGGSTWHPVQVGGTVNDLAISAGEVYATVSPNGTNSGRLLHSPVGQDQWSTVTAAGEVSAGLWVQGGNVLVQSGNGGAYGSDLLVSHNGGASFATYPAPTPGLPCEFEGAAAPDVWAHCATGMQSGVWLSHDGGASFASAEHAGAHLMLPNSAVFGAASGTTAVVGYQQLYRTGDAGVTWTPVGPSGIAQWVYLGFSDATHGVAIGYSGSVAPANERLYYTTDAGRSYHLVPMP